jgi:myo-inositol-1(or 4)-monophosphatase
MSTPGAELDAALAFSVDVAREAGAILIQGFGAGAARVLGRRQRADTKGSDIDLVTEYDRRAEAAIVGRLRARFPGDRVLAEEGAGGEPGGTRGGARWLVDPLDGTTNFAHGLPVFCVSIAREPAGGGPVDVGCVYAPALDLLFAARRGGGATCNGEPIHVSDESRIGRAMLATGFPYDRHTSDENNFAQFVAFQRRAQAVRRLGSAAIDLALVAAGTYDGYWEMKLKPWDMAAGALLVEEAGGCTSGWRGEAFSVDRAAAVASNGRIHEAMLEVIASLPIPSAAIA